MTFDLGRVTTALGPLVAYAGSIAVTFDLGRVTTLRKVVYLTFLRLR